MATVHGWAIVGECGLYTGWFQTRVSAIGQHVYDLQAPLSRGEPEIDSPYAWGGKLTEQQKIVWERCKRNGDRAVKVRITYVDQ